MFSENLTTLEIIIRLCAAMFIGGAIGYERGSNNRPAGFRTHILVCLGAAVVSITQDLLRENLINFILIHPEVKNVIRTDLGRLGAQVISGIGFLGAGTIMRDKGTIGGLTTAASIWATGCIGLAIGWGFYNLAIPAGVAILIILVFLRKIEIYLIDNKHIVRIDVRFKDEGKYARNILETYECLTLMNIKIKNIKKNSKENTIHYTLMVTKNINICEIIAELSKLGHISQVQIP